MSAIETENVFFHVTPVFNRGAIELYGIDPDKARSKVKRSWYVGRAKLMWAIAHVSARYSVPVDQLVVFSVARPEAMRWIRTAWPQIWQCNELCKVFGAQSAAYYVAQDEGSDWPY